MGWFRRGDDAAVSLDALRAQLLVEQSKLRATVYRATIPMSFGAFDRDLGEFNDAMCGFYELPREELMHHTWRDFGSLEDQAEDAIHSARLARGEIDHYSIVKRYRLLNGKVKWGQLTVTAVDLPGAPRGWSIAQIVDVTEAYEAKSALQRLVDVDQITGLRSRAWMTARIDELLGAGTRRIAVGFLELAEFLVVYRTLGYEAGDAVLRTLAQRVRAALPPEVEVGRFEGMTLILMFPDVRGREDLELCIADALRVTAEEVSVGGRRISRTGSTGVAVSRPGDTTITLLRDADHALLFAERGGRSRFRIVGFEGAVEEPTMPLELEHALRNALDLGQFVVHFQPQVRLSDGAVCGYEALARWKHPQRGLVAPSEFIGIMEDSALVIRLGRQVLGKVCDEIRQHPELGVPVSLNVSAVEVAEDDWLDVVTDTIRASGIAPQQLVLELTETAMLDLHDDALAALRALRAMGVGIHLDDFGTGYTSVSTLLSLPITAVKLDRSFSEPLADPTPGDMALVRAIAALAASLDLVTIAEGIETEAQALALRTAGWAIGQGYLYGHPVATLRP